MESRRADYYRIPAYYDIIHSKWTAWELRGLEHIAERFVATPRRRDGQVWFEPACGTARLLLPAAKRGRRVIGMDLSEPMLDYARRRFDRAGLQHRAALHFGDITDFDETIVPRSWAGSGGRRRGRGASDSGGVGAGGVDFAFNLINTIRHLPSDRAMLAHFECISRVLRPGGVYAVGIGLARYFAEFPVEDVWESARGRCHVRQVIQYTPPLGEAEVRARREQVLSHITVTRPRGVEHIESSYWLRTYSPSQWDRLIARSTLRTLAIVDEYGRPLVSEPSGYAVWILTHG